MILTDAAEELVPVNVHRQSVRRLRRVWRRVSLAGDVATGDAGVEARRRLVADGAGDWAGWDAFGEHVEIGSEN